MLVNDMSLQLVLALELTATLGTFERFDIRVRELMQPKFVGRFERTSTLWARIRDVGVDCANVFAKISIFFIFLRIRKVENNLLISACKLICMRLTRPHLGHL